MKTLVVGLGALLLVGLAGARSASAYPIGYGPNAFYGAGFGYSVPAYPYPYQPYGYAGYPYYPYPLPPAPSLGFGRGGIYGHVFVGRGEGTTAYTLPGANSGY